MSTTFYHLDRSNTCEVGDRLDLEWPGKIQDNLDVRSGAKNQVKLRELYPEGLSRHGARYAHAALVSKSGSNLPDSYEPMAGVVNVVERGQLTTKTISPFSVRDEFFVELVRMTEFEEYRSRFQSFFAFEELEEAISFYREHRSGPSQILEVTCEEYVKRDMNLVSGMFFGTGIANANEYWQGNPGNDPPTWEIVMEPPVKITGHIRDLSDTVEDF